MRKAQSKKRMGKYPKIRFDEREAKAAVKDKYNGSNGGNDISWYNADPSMFSNIDWNVVQGLPIDMGYTQDVGTVSPFVNAGICALDIIPTIGGASSPSDPINVAAMAMYSYVRHTVSGGANYEPIDMMQYVYAMSCVYSWIVHLQRIYGAVTLYSHVNRYTPVTLVQAMGADCTEIQMNMADYRAGINMLINKAAALAVPTVFTIFPRQAFLYKDVYMAGDSMRDQMYLMRPAGYYVYDEVKAQLTWNSITYSSSTLMNHTQLLQIGMTMIDALLESQSIGNISGDIKKAYGESLIKLTSLSDNYVIIPTVNRIVLEQFMNATAIGAGDGTNTKLTVSDIIQNPGTAEEHKTNYLSQTIKSKIISENQTKAAALAVRFKSLRRNQLINTRESNPTMDLTIENTRLMSSASTFNATTKEVTYISGSEILRSFSIYNENRVINWESVQDNLTDVEAISMYNQFDFAPRLEIFRKNPQGTNYQFFTLQDLDNYTLIAPYSLEYMHAACLQNEFHVPSVGKMV